MGDNDLCILDIKPKGFAYKNKGADENIFGASYTYRKCFLYVNCTFIDQQNMFMCKPMQAAELL